MKKVDSWSAWVWWWARNHRTVVYFPQIHRPCWTSILSVASDFYSISRSSAKPHKLILFFTSGYLFSGKKECKSPGFSKTRAQIPLLCDSVLIHSTAALILTTKMDPKKRIVQNLIYIKLSVQIMILEHFIQESEKNKHCLSSGGKGLILT